MRALQTAYAERNISVAVELPPELPARGDERDFMEILGNLLENAFKYTHSQIRVTAAPAPDVGLCIDDDGPGIAAELRSEVLRRGARADEVQSGQGIGLSVVVELVASYQGELSIDDGELGGARVCVTLPGDA